eukprot:TRINITY_DN2460_c0_g3_i1.p1 TRINITY_DN2460_c0_g3~~TRINITY_DN2460_c0_g3_i1.p1  ORF type:complete len:712 (-),score=22.69 TRINITY_DN2460_c0_g3_i1:274-2214(-)
MVLVLFLLIKHQVTLNIRESFYVTLCFILVMLIVLIAQYLFPQNTQNYSILRGGVMLIFILVQFVVFLIKWFQRQFLPILHRKNSVVTRLVYKTVDVNNGAQSFSSRRQSKRILYYDSVWRFLPTIFVRPKYIEYCGEVDPVHRKPHGQGVWRDSDWHGEILSGRWENGIPAGPFGSRELGSNSSFVCLKMAFWQDRSDKCDQISYFARYTEPTVGMMSAECCVLGVFFKEYPIVHQVWGPAPYFQEEIENLRALNGQINDLSASNGQVLEQDIEESLLHNQENSHRISDIEDVTSPLTHCLRSLNDIEEATNLVDSQLDLQQQLQGQGEALIFIHGYNCALSDASKLFGQFLALCNLPPNVKPIIFSWNALRDFAYIPAINQGTDAPQTTRSFLQLLRALQKEGYERIHILAHSMGIRVMMAALPYLETILGIEQGGYRVGMVKTDYSGLFFESEIVQPLNIIFETVTLLNPDYSLDDFVNGLGQRLCRLCPIVTIYGNQQDNALIYAAMAVGLFKFLHNIERQALPSKSTKKLENNFFQSYNGQQREPKHNWIWDPMLGKHITWVIDPSAGQHLDVDIIDTTFIQTNVHSMKHMYFNLNGDILADLRELITQKKRAVHRVKLEQVGETIFRFRVAPPYVKNRNA